jgi:hypothetical protein
MPTLVAVMQAKLDLKKDVLVNQIKNIPNNIIHNYGWSKKNIE